MSTQISGQITVTTAGTAVQGTDIQGGGFLILPLPSNTDDIYIGDGGTGDVDSTTGYVLSAGASPLIIYVPNLSTLWFDAAVSGEGICWIRIEA